MAYCVAIVKQARLTLDVSIVKQACHALHICQSGILLTSHASILDLLHDSILLNILEKLPRPSDRLAWSLSCKHFYMLEASCRSHVSLLRTHSVFDLAWRYPRLQHLDLSSCTSLTDDRLRSVALAMGKRLLSLNLAKIRTFTYLGLTWLAKHCASLLHLNLSGCWQLQDLSVMAIAHIQSLHSLNLKGCKDVTDLGLVFMVSNCKKLHSLCLKWCIGVTDETLVVLGENCLELQELNLSFTEITNTGIAAISKLSRVEKLSFVACNRLNDVCLEHIKNGLSKSLKTLDVSRCRGISYAGVMGLASGAFSLKHIGLSYCVLSRDATPPSSIRLKGLQSIQLDGCDVSTFDLGMVRTCGMTLKELSLSKCKGLSDAGLLAAVTGCAGLQSLDLTCCHNLTDVGLSSVAVSCKGLTSLKIESCTMITEHGIVELCNSCLALEYLDLTDTCINDAGLMSVAKCKSLRTLKLGFCEGIQDEGLSYIASGCPKLTELDIYRSIRISDMGVAAICMGCPNLTSLNMAYNTQITDTALFAVAGLRDLRVLEIRSCFQVTSLGLLAVARSCHRLAELDVKMCTLIEDSTPLALAQYCNNLQQINLSYCLATDKGMVALASLNRMQNMCLVHVKNVSVKGFSDLLLAGESLKKVKLLVYLKEVLEPAIVEQVERRGCKIRWTEKL